MGVVADGAGADADADAGDVVRRTHCDFFGRVFLTTAAMIFHSPFVSVSILVEASLLEERGCRSATFRKLGWGLVGVGYRPVSPDLSNGGCAICPSSSIVIVVHRPFLVVSRPTRKASRKRTISSRHFQFPHITSPNVSFSLINTNTAFAHLARHNKISKRPGTLTKNTSSTSKQTLEQTRTSNQCSQTCVIQTIQTFNAASNFTSSSLHHYFYTG